jgi:hypothetical protein
MIRFTSTAKLQVLLAGAVTTNELPLFATWSDQTATTYAGDYSASITTGTTAVDLVAAPSSGVNRDIDHLSIHNADTAAATVTVRVNISGTTRILVKAVLAVGDTMHWTHGTGWRVLDSTGSFKSSGGGTTYSVFTTTDDGLVPSPGAGSGRVLREDATWVTPANGLVLLASGTAASVSSIDFTSLITSTYECYALNIINLVPATTGVCYIRTSTNNGSSYDSGASDYSYTGMETTASGSSAVTNSTGAAQIALGGNSILQTTANGGLSGWLYLFDPLGTTHYKQMRFDGTYAQSGGLFGINLSANRISTADVDAFRLIMASGNIASCKYKFYGVQKL